jgi:hypothetical protein
MTGNQRAMYEEVKVFITETLLVKFSVITIQQNFIHFPLPSPAPASDFRMAVQEYAKNKMVALI